MDTTSALSQLSAVALEMTAIGLAILALCAVALLYSWVYYQIGGGKRGAEMRRHQKLVADESIRGTGPY